MPFLNLDPTAATPIVQTLGAPLVSQEETLLSLQNELLAMMGGRSDIDPTRLTRWINQAYRDLATSLDIPEFNVSISFPTVASQNLYLLPTSIARTRRAALINTTTYSADGGIPLTKITPDYFRGLPDQDDVPTSYFYQNRLIVLYARPNLVNTVVIDAVIRPQPLVGPTDSPIFSADWNETLLLAARSKAFRALLEMDNAATAENDLVSQIRRKRDTASDEREGEIAAFRPARSFRSRRRFSPPRNDF